MRETLGDEEQIRRYLLGELSEAEMARLEDDAFTGPGGEDLQSIIASVENDLMDEYARGELPSGERARFEARFLTSERRCRRVGFAAALVATEKEGQAALAGRADARPARARSTLDSLLAFLRSPSQAVKFALGSAALLVAAGLVWYALDSSHRRAEEARLKAERRLVDERARADELARAQQGAHGPQRPGELAPAPSPSASQTPKPPGNVKPLRGRHAQRGLALATFTILPGSLRGEGDDLQTLIVPKGGRLVRLRLVLDDIVLHGDMRAEVFAGEQKILSRAKLRPRRAVTGNIITVDVPVGLLAPGPYLIKLEGQTIDGGTVTTIYNFKVLLK
jgi:hypothetical protein